MLHRTIIIALAGILSGCLCSETSAAPPPPISFKNDVMPVFLRGGCNSGSCHGAARGKDGFKLSLFGYDPGGDYYRLLEEYVGRRINLAAPAKSLLLEKISGSVPYTGGRISPPNSQYYEYAAKVDCGRCTVEF